eukprot:TRINITY_DN17434_c0_g1_i1.p2 TRINITY_DN17434_c0_g1~~TRINITY_DN17434_c0_g1_i1.p2  ORF type:complete len:124 (+),score=31.75 TRINITY_DN17434_c0_g1_i1:399-770(+)
MWSFSPNVRIKATDPRKKLKVLAMCTNAGVAGCSLTNLLYLCTTGLVDSFWTDCACLAAIICSSIAGSIVRVFCVPYSALIPVSYTHLRAHETPEHLVCRLLLEKKKKKPEEIQKHHKKKNKS